MEKTKQYIMAIDSGTTSSRAIIFNRKAEIVSCAKMEFGQIVNEKGWVEESPQEIWETTFEVIKEALYEKGLRLRDIAALGISNQRETTILWDKKTGEPVYNAIVWQSRQSQGICEDWIARGYESLVHEKTGLIINPYFSASKIRWILDNVPQAREKAEEGRLLFGTVDTYLTWMLTQGELHVTDVSNASRTMLYDIKALSWDQELLDLFKIPRSLLPEVHASSEELGIAKALWDIDESADVPICSLIGDQQASLFGHCCFNIGDIKNTYGTGCFMLMNTKKQPCFSSKGLLTTIAWSIDGEVDYALEGSVFVGGAAVQWLRDGLRMIQKSDDVEIYSTREPTASGVYVVPAFVGLGTPYWDNDARGAVFGLTRSTKKEHFINATVEAIAYQSKDVMEAMKEESGIKITTLEVDGGASVNDYLMQFQADILAAKLVRPAVLEVTALGAAYLAGLAVHFWSGKDEIVRNRRIDRLFLPKMSEAERDERYEGWKTAIRATRAFKRTDKKGDSHA